MIPSAWYVLELSSAVRFSAVVIGVSLFAFISMREISILHGKLKAQAVTDKLTGLLNRTLREDSLKSAISQNWRFGLPMTIFSLDIDQFKSINDMYGHDKGDLVLERMGELIRGRIRSCDMAFQLGGEEFLILVHNTDQNNAIKVAEKLRQEIEQTDLLPDHQVTMSIGISGLQEGMELDTWLKISDEKLYRAKDCGRKCVVS